MTEQYPNNGVPGVPEQQPQYGQPQYGQQQYAQQQYVQPQYVQRPTNTLAIVALILSFFVSLGGIICGHIALKQCKERNEAGSGMAIAGLVIGYVSLAITVIWIIVAASFVGAVSSYDY